jgi:hypothetical protein
MQMQRFDSRKKLGEAMLLPILIFMLTLSPVLIPAVASVFHVVANRRRNYRESRGRRDVGALVRLTIQSIGREPTSTATQPA